MKRILPLCLTVLLFTSCSKGGDKRLAEQEEIKARQQLQAQNENQREWAEKMEKHLDKRKNFFKALQGEFEGSVDVQGTEFQLSAKFIPSIPVEFYNRVRTLDEINYEIQNLNLNINIKIENPRAANSAVSCTIEDYKPDFVNGVINIISESCKNIFMISITDNLDELPIVQRREGARRLARDVISGRVEVIEFLDGTFESSVSSIPYNFKLKRVL